MGGFAEREAGVCFSATKARGSLNLSCAFEAEKHSLRCGAASRPSHEDRLFQHVERLIKRHKNMPLLRRQRAFGFRTHGGGTEKQRVRSMYALHADVNR